MVKNNSDDQNQIDVVTYLQWVRDFVGRYYSRTGTTFLERMTNREDYHDSDTWNPDIARLEQKVDKLLVTFGVEQKTILTPAQARADIEARLSKRGT